MIGSLRNTIAVALAVWLGATPIKQLTADNRYLIGALLVVLTMQTVAALARRFSRFGWAPTVAQFVLTLTGFWVACQQIAGLAGFEPWAPVGRVFAATFEHIGAEAAPMGPHDATLVVLLAAVALLVIATDLLFIAAASALWAGLPVAAGYLTTMVALDEPTAAWSLVVVALGWGVLLASRTIDHERRWPRGLSRETGARLNVRNFTALALGLGVAALTGALLAGTLVPTTGRDWARGDGGDGTVQLTDPSIQLNENLRRPEERPVLSYTTTAPGGVLLRSSTLTKVDADGWHQIDMSLQRGFPNRIPGLETTEATVSTQISIGDFESSYLPAPYAPVSWDAAGEWNYDPVSLTVLSVDRQAGAAAVRNLSYSVESRSSEPTAEQLATAIAGTPPEGTVASEAPAEVPAQIAELAHQITADGQSDGERAVLLQNWLRDPERFSYDLDAPEGTGYNALVGFLFTERRGYCVHFAASMALMARQVGIPARVAIGFTTGTEQDDGSWLVTSHNMHAWPELYFAGLGWVRFEPTASVGNEPAWTDLPAPAEQSAPAPSPTPTAEASPSPQPGEQPPDDTPTEQPETLPIDWRWLAGIGGVLLMLLASGLLRAAQRARRLAEGPVEAKVGGAWRELQASAIDLGLGWPELTPRQLAGASWPGMDADGRQALRRIALLVELRDYSPGLPDDVSVAGDVAAVTDQWRASADRWTRLWTRLVPRSLLMNVRWPWSE